MAVTKETTVRNAHGQVTINSAHGVHVLGLGEQDEDGNYLLTDAELSAIVEYAIEMKLAVRPRGKRGKKEAVVKAA